MLNRPSIKEKSSEIEKRKNTSQVMRNLFVYVEESEEEVEEDDHDNPDVPDVRYVPSCVILE